YAYRQNRKRRSDHYDSDSFAHSLFTPKRRNTDQNESYHRYMQGNQGATTISSSYFNNNRIFNKQTNEPTYQKRTYESSNRKQQKRESFPPFRIRLKVDKYPTQDVTIIKELNQKCKLNLTYGRISTSKNDKCYLLYCNTSSQFESLLDKSKWPDKIYDCEYTFDLPQKIPSSYSVVMLNIPVQWNVQGFCEELKQRYKTIVKAERLFVKG
ncbi:unnamed protein product, partial [Didymodactylos carnosus]